MNDFLEIKKAVNDWKMACPYTEGVNPSFHDQDLLCILTRNNKSIYDALHTLLAVGEWESGLWLRALQLSNIRTMLDDTNFRLATCLRLGTPYIAPHRYHW